MGSPIRLYGTANIGLARPSPVTTAKPLVTGRAEGHCGRSRHRKHYKPAPPCSAPRAQRGRQAKQPTKGRALHDRLTQWPTGRPNDRRNGDNNREHPALSLPR